MRTTSMIGLFMLCIFGSGPTLACSCVRTVPGSVPPPSITERTTAVPGEAAFEGTVVKTELHGFLIDSREGSLIPVGLDDWGLDSIFMQITFDVSRSYPSDGRKTAVVKTGLGGGDCGYPFVVGKKYLVDAGKDQTGHLYTGVCSQTTSLESGQPGGAGTPSGKAEICGHVVEPQGDVPAASSVFLFNDGDHSPVPFDEAGVEDDTSFCAKNVDPGEYILLFVAGSEDSPTAFAFYPGVVKRSDAKKIRLNAGQHLQNLLINVPFQPSYSVKGSITAFDEVRFELSPKVFLVEEGQFSPGTLFMADVSQDGSFEFPRVFPGKYWAVVDVESDSGAKWFTKKVSISVNNNVSGLSMTLIQK